MSRRSMTATAAHAMLLRLASAEGLVRADLPDRVRVTMRTYPEFVAGTIDCHNFAPVAATAGV